MTTATSPDLFNIYTPVATGSTGIVSISSLLLHLPSKVSYIVLSQPPTTGLLKVDGVNVITGDTEILRVDLDANKLQWHSGSPNTTQLLDISYFGFDDNDQAISLLQVYYPPDTVQDITINIVNGGNFLAGEAGFGVAPDAGDFDTGDFVINGYSYDGGDFDTGERAGVAPPPLSSYNFYADGELDPELENIVMLLDEDLEPVQTSQLPNAQFIDSGIIMPDLLFDLNYTFEIQIGYVTKYFEGFDYGSIAPNAGYDIDYGSVEAETAEGYDFNNIIDYEDPIPGNVAT